MTSLSSTVGAAQCSSRGNSLHSEITKRRLFEYAESHAIEKAKIPAHHAASGGSALSLVLGRMWLNTTLAMRNVQAEVISFIAN
jgi:hypothetical protein